ncbi:hypothetical protein Tco_0205703 [Tanacetum coccineum]
MAGPHLSSGVACNQQLSKFHLQYSPKKENSFLFSLKFSAASTAAYEYALWGIGPSKMHFIRYSPIRFSVKDVLTGVDMLNEMAIN